MRSFRSSSTVSLNQTRIAASARINVQVAAAGGGRSGESVSRAYDSGESRDDGPVSSNAHDRPMSSPISRENLEVPEWIPHDGDAAISSLDEFINAGRSSGGSSGDTMEGFRGGIVRGSRVKYTDPSGLPLRR